MVRYTLFGYEIVFVDAAMRYYEIRRMGIDATQKVTQDFKAWYAETGSIEKVLSNYEDFVKKAIYNYGIMPFFAQLPSHNIYDMSEINYRNRCSSFSNSYNAINDVANKYEKIVEAQGDAEAYRAARKAYRGRWQGGGFGMKGAIKGAVEAGALNAVSGIGHSAVNAVGNAASAASAASEKKKLYKNASTEAALLKGLKVDLEYAIDSYIDILNEHHKEYVRDSFSYDKASALFSNAKQLPEKREELLAKAFSSCPWYSDLLCYIFENYLTERKTVCEAAKQFHVNISAAVNAAIAKEYSPSDKNSEERAMQARKRILALMEEYNVSENDTLDQLEYDCLKRLCIGYETANEETCNKIKASIQAYEALGKNKAPFLDQIQKRIEEIWSAEDNEIFDNYYLTIDITDSNEVSQAIKYVQSKGRTSSSEKYIAAFEACKPHNLRKARAYRKGIIPSIFIAMAIALCFFALFNIFILEGNVLISGLSLVAGIILSCVGHSYSKIWKILTINETVFHPEISQNMPKAKTGLFTGVLSVVLVVVLCAGSVAIRGLLQISEEQTYPNDIIVNEDEVKTAIPDWCNGTYYNDNDDELRFHNSDQIVFDLSLCWLAEISDCVGTAEENAVSFLGEIDEGTETIAGLLTYTNGEITLFISYSETDDLPEGTTMSFYDTKPTMNNQAAEIIAPEHLQEIVVSAYGSTATLTLQEWEYDHWAELLSFDAYIGDNGITEYKTEGDHCTPAGTFDICFAFSTAANLQTGLPYIQIGVGDVWVDDPNSYYYNTLQNDSNQYKDWSSSEDLYKKFSEHRSAACIYFAFNGDGLNGGSADAYYGSDLFIDGVASEGNLTSGYGDIKITESDMIILLQMLDIEKSPCITIS